MLKQDKIKTRVKEILADDRLAYKTATIFTNTPLALFQLQMEVELHTLEKVLEVPLTNIKKLRNE